VNEILIHVYHQYERATLGHLRRSSYNDDDALRHSFSQQTTIKTSGRQKIMR
jgi:hypothetical protein